MEENHKVEQYFFRDDTKEKLIKFLKNYDNICCLCCPTIGIELEKLGKKVTILDIDKRFSDSKSFIYYDLYKPTQLEIEFDILICDPPFNIVSLSQLFYAIRILCNYDYSKRILISYQKRREHSIIGTFNNFNISQTGFLPRYKSITKNYKKYNFEFYSNLSKQEIQLLTNNH